MRPYETLHFMMTTARVPETAILNTILRFTIYFVVVVVGEFSLQHHRYAVHLEHQF